jgi:hypothetical protein
VCADVCGGILNENTIPVMIECIYRGQDACDVLVSEQERILSLCCVSLFKMLMMMRHSGLMMPSCHNPSAVSPISRICVFH